MMSTYKRKRIDWILSNFEKEIDKLAELANLISEKYQLLPEQKVRQTKEAIEGFDLIDPVVEEVRDQYLISEPIARKLVVDCIRLRRRGKI